jgi:AcrR family transcriptional regulator
LTKRSGKTRQYRSPVRAEAQERTRERILAAVMDHLAEEAGEITLRAIARRAEVSTPTVIRYFPDREALLEAFWDWAHPMGIPQGTPTPEQAPLFPPKLYKLFDQHEKFFRALLTTREGRAERSRRLGERADVSKRVFEPLLAELTPERKKSVLGVLRMLVSGLPIWLELRDFYGIDGEEAGRAVSWALKILVEELQRNPKSPQV